MIDVVLMKESEDIKEFSRELGYSDIYFLDEKDIGKDLKELNKKKFLIFLGGYEDVNRKAIESKKIKILLNPEPKKKDTLKQKTSGLNQVLCKFAHQNGVAVAFSLDRLQNQKIIGKIIQNIRLCRKYKVRMLFFTLAKNKYDMRAAKDLLSVCRVLGMNTSETKKAISGEEILKGNI